MHKIMIVEDDERLALELKVFLENNGYEVFSITDFENVVEQILKGDEDLVILDYKLPFYNGGYILKEVRKQSEMPIIMATSVNDEVNELINLSNGADDYITKPFNTQILLLRMEKLLARNTKSYSSTLKYEDLILDVSKSLLLKGDDSLELSKNESAILSYLLKNRGTIVSRDDLMDYLWGTSEFIDDNTLTVNVSRIRSKLSSLGYDHVIETKRGQGYIIL